MSATSFNKRRMDIDVVLALLDQRTPETDQVRDIGDVVAVLAEPEDDSFGAFGAVDRHFIEGVFDCGLGYAPEPGLRESTDYSFEAPLVMFIEFLL